MINSMKRVIYRKKELGHTSWGEVGVGGWGRWEEFEVFNGEFSRNI